MKKNYHFLCVKNYLIFDSSVNNVLPPGKLLPLILRLNDQYLNITGKYQYDVLLSLCKQNSGVFLPSIRFSCRKSKWWWAIFCSNLSGWISSVARGDEGWSPRSALLHLLHSQKSWVILLMNIHKPNRVMYDVGK